MSFKPSKRLKGEMEGELNLNLNSMMDLFGVLIPALLMMSAAVEATIISVVAPSTNPDSSAAPPPTPEKPPLNLTVTITEGGFIVVGAGAVIGGPGAGGPLNLAQPSIPLIEKSVGCTRYKKSWPPPRSKNKETPPCEDRKYTAEDQGFRQFWVYNLEELTKQIIAIKTEYPEDRKVIIQPAPTVEYETIIDVMDATRDFVNAKGETEVLFDEVLISGGI